MELLHAFFQKIPMVVFTVLSGNPRREELWGK
jgi:hypothetical protein